MDATLGFTRDEIIANVLDSIGRPEDSVLTTRLQKDINTALLSFWKMFEWKFGRTVPFSYFFTLVDNSPFYTLNTATIGCEMRATDVDKLYLIDPQWARVLEKIESREMRIMDPTFATLGVPIYYSIQDANTIQLWPIPSLTGPSPNIVGSIVYIDGKRQPTFMTLGTDYPDIPTEYQETFQQYLLYRTLSRERDPRQVEELQIFKDMLEKDKQADMAEIESNLRLKYPEEELMDGFNRPGNFNAYWNFWNRD